MARPCRPSTLVPAAVWLAPGRTRWSSAGTFHALHERASPVGVGRVEKDRSGGPASSGSELRYAAPETLAGVIAQRADAPLKPVDVRFVDRDVVECADLDDRVGCAARSRHRRMTRRSPISVAAVREVDVGLVDHDRTNRASGGELRCHSRRQLRARHAAVERGAEHSSSVIGDRRRRRLRRHDGSERPSSPAADGLRRPALGECEPSRASGRGALAIRDQVARLTGCRS